MTKRVRDKRRPSARRAVLPGPYVTRERRSSRPIHDPPDNGGGAGEQMRIAAIRGDDGLGQRADLDHAPVLGTQAIARAKPGSVCGSLRRSASHGFLSRSDSAFGAACADLLKAIPEGIQPPTIEAHETRAASNISHGSLGLTVDPEQFLRTDPNFVVERKLRPRSPGGGRPLGCHGSAAGRLQPEPSYSGLSPNS